MKPFRAARPEIKLLVEVLLEPVGSKPKTVTVQLGVKKDRMKVKAIDVRPGPEAQGLELIALNYLLGTWGEHRVAIEQARASCGTRSHEVEQTCCNDRSAE